MAEIVLGVASSHSPIVNLPYEKWPEYASRDPGNPALIAPYSQGKRVTYDDLLAHADPKLSNVLTMDVFQQQYETLQNGIATLSQTLLDCNPDVIVAVGDDQDEIYFDDNYPAISVYWGETFKMVARQGRPGIFEHYLEGHGKEQGDYPVDSKLGLHLIESLMDQDFDVAHSRYMKGEYGGSIGPIDYIERPRRTAPRPHGMGHAWTFVISRLLKGKQIPMVPVTINTCYPPNVPSPKRCYQLGQAIRRAVEAYPANVRVAVATSGGLSHFVVDEEIDRWALDAMKNKDIEAIAKLPKERMSSAASEIRNWITTAGACEGLEMEELCYVAGYRSPAGTGGGWGAARWV